MQTVIDRPKLAGYKSISLILLSVGISVSCATCGNNARTMVDTEPLCRVARVSNCRVLRKYTCCDLRHARYRRDLLLQIHIALITWSSTCINFSSYCDLFETNCVETIHFCSINRLSAVAGIFIVFKMHTVPRKYLHILWAMGICGY